MTQVSIINKTHPLQSLLFADYCASFFKRGLGWMFKPRINPVEAKLLVQPHQSRLDASIHMLFVSFDLGIVWLNQDLCVTEKTIAKAWRLSYVPRVPARFVLEIHPDRLNEFLPGDQIELLNG